MTIKTTVFVAFAASLTLGVACVVSPVSTASSIDFSKPEPGEQFPGGAATSKKSVRGVNAFSHASGNMPFSREFNFKIGNGIFKKLWVSSPASTKSSDGLGPLFNARACQRCHLKDGRGHPPAGPHDNAVSMLFRIGIKYPDGSFKPEPVYGGQFQDFGIQGVKPEGKIVITYKDIPVELNGGEVVVLRKPNYAVSDLAYGPMAKNLVISPRIANQMIGLGLLEAIPAKDILALADPDDRDGDGVSGKAQQVLSIVHKKIMLGRFNWKASQPSVKQQSAGAFNNDMGLSTTLFPRHAGDCTRAQTRCAKAPNGAQAKTNDVEVSDQMLDLVAFYARNLAVPKRRGFNQPNILVGKKLFHVAGCASCHVPKFRTRKDAGVAPEQRDQLIWPYTDLLLHDMGPGLADGFEDGKAKGNEWRTAPLWGIGLTRSVNGHTFFLHDGRARNILEAILWHGGEAAAARQKVIDMTKAERDKLIAFVNSL